MKRILSFYLLLVLFLIMGCSSVAWAKTVTLAWDPSPSAVSGYKVYYQVGSDSLSKTGEAGTVVVDVGSVLTYSLSHLNDAEDYYFAVTAYDANGQESDFSNHVHSPAVVAINHPPVLAPIGTKSVNEGQELAFTILATDADGDPLTYGAANLPAGATFNATTRQFVWTPNYSGSENIRVFSVTFSVNDGSAEDTELVTINVNPVNRPPVLRPIGAQELLAGDNFNLIISATDPDTALGQNLTYSAVNLPSGAVFLPATRSFSWLPGIQQVGTYQVTFVVHDGRLQDSEVVPFTVVRANEPPVLAAIGTQSVHENALLQFSVAATTESANFVYRVSGLPAGASFDTASRTFSWTPDYDQAGSFIVTFAVTDGVDTDSEAVTITVHNTNRPPVISGTPDPTASVDRTYVFAPVASDPDGDDLSYTISGQPFWAEFNSQTGVLSGTPIASDLGSRATIVITVGDGSLTTSLPAFSIEVVAAADDSEPSYVDGEIDSDRDGIPDVRDGFPFDPNRTDWVIYASAGTGGYIDPAGEVSVLYGGTQRFELIPMAGYYLNDLLVNGMSVPLRDNYEFVDVDSHNTIEAIFSEIPSGLSQNPLEPGLKGIERVDDGDDSNNLVDGKPRLDLDYRFHVTLREEDSLDQYRVFAVINGYRYLLQQDAGVPASGARFSMTTRLGPLPAQRYYFVVENAVGTQLWRYPAVGDLPGPTVELLSGHNMVGLVGNLNPYGLTTTETIGVRQVYRWSPSAKKEGAYVMVDSGAPIASGEGYQLRRATSTTLPDLSAYGELSVDLYEFDVFPGWNLIANPYAGNVPLERVLIRSGDAVPMEWLAAATQDVVVDGLHSYLGDDWGGGNEVTTAAGTNKAILVPGMGYWIYVNPVNQPVSLLIPRPLR
ncbi:fibronectin type III domain-containing protein [Pelovirga terrestris]|uniref:Putative Ig domain-containing protein n=1 Tax=Pelovirga terrestris TaxID=2771352 RepID=A0A8J6UH50_9BACT|nr:fibronectin type III domain-containing protein [Pelovirga terrestris]MBD1400918.1 putative Ig domain-containing protein [Pelovirga terrestris]